LGAQGYEIPAAPWASGLAINIRLVNVLLPGDLAVWDGHVAMMSAPRSRSSAMRVKTS